MRNTKRKNRGFTIIEMLLALTITALLLTALAASINASMININANEDSYKAINNARQALGRICAQLRTCGGVVVAESSNWCGLVTDEGDIISFRFDSGDKTLYLWTLSNWQQYVLCDGVESMTFTKGVDPDDPGVVRNVQISMTIKVGNVTKKLSTATVIMRNMP